MSESLFSTINVDLKLGSFVDVYSPVYNKVITARLIGRLRDGRYSLMGEDDSIYVRHSEDIELLS